MLLVSIELRCSTRAMQSVAPEVHVRRLTQHSSTGSSATGEATVVQVKVSSCHSCSACNASDAKQVRAAARLRSVFKDTLFEVHARVCTEGDVREVSGERAGGRSRAL